MRVKIFCISNDREECSNVEKKISEWIHKEQPSIIDTQMSSSGTGAGGGGSFSSQGNHRTVILFRYTSTRPPAQ